jgi:epoxyqueuosine reductase
VFRERLSDLGRVLAHLEAHGLNLHGALSGEVYDARVPEPWKRARAHPSACAVLVVASGGRAFWACFERSPAARLRRDPVDRYAQRVLREAARLLGPQAGVATYAQRRGGRFVPLSALAQASGIGVPSRLGLLIHPEYGPWLSLRGLIYLPVHVKPSQPLRQRPCEGCPAPCRSACIGSAVDLRGFDLGLCLWTKWSDRRCARDCSARRACVIGPAHSFPPAQLAQHAKLRWNFALLRRALALWILGLARRVLARGRRPAS